jgi:uncharacterized protein YecT (DUF1311 family)
VRTHTTIFVAAAVLIGAAAFAWADDKDKKDTESEQSCVGDTYQMVECFGKLTEQWDQRLNKAYQEALKDIEPEQGKQLRTAQRLWIQYRDANCLYYRLDEGSLARVDSAECFRTMTERRAIELEGGNPRY